ncbi:EAL domain-containing protein [Pseudovibrio flavus]|uniref:EAL domain-containing protein n=1 Tax=Pseudovibrio flavus TaxID=2529854 RepID=UPI00211CFBDE|nr:EAL domain-containing protein [Pseudovibrio flavus]
MMIIAGSCGMVLVYQFARPLGEAVSISVAMFCLLAVLHLLVTRGSERNNLSDAMDRLEDRVSEVDEDLSNLEGRLTGVETNIPARTREEIDPLFAEVEVIGSLVKQMAEAMADMEARLEDQRVSDMQPQMHLPPQPQHRLEAPNEQPPHSGGYQEPAGQTAQPHSQYTQQPVYPEPRIQRPNPALAAEIRAAIDANRVDLYLQPIVTLPQRRVRFYEVLTRLRTLDGDLLEPVEFLAEAIRIKQIATLDNLQLFRSLQIIKRLSARNREAGLFCNLSPATLVDESFFPGFLEFVKANESYADLLVFEFTQADVASMGLLEFESLAALSDLGFRFSIDHITDLRMDFKALADKGFRYAKLNAARLLMQDESLAQGNIHPSDFGALIQRFGMELIVDHVETEATLVELLDLDTRNAQGHLFSPPRPVRADVLKGAPSPRAPRRAEAS